MCVGSDAFGEKRLSDLGRRGSLIWGEEAL